MDRKEADIKDLVRAKQETEESKKSSLIKVNGVLANKIKEIARLTKLNYELQQSSESARVKDLEQRLEQFESRRKDQNATHQNQVKRLNAELKKKNDQEKLIRGSEKTQIERADTMTLKLREEKERSRELQSKVEDAQRSLVKLNAELKIRNEKVSQHELKEAAQAKEIESLAKELLEEKENGKDALEWKSKSEEKQKTLAKNLSVELKEKNARVSELEQRLRTTEAAQAEEMDALSRELSAEKERAKEAQALKPKLEESQLIIATLEKEVSSKKNLETDLLKARDSQLEIESLMEEEKRKHLELRSAHEAESAKCAELQKRISRLETAQDIARRNQEALLGEKKDLTDRIRQLESEPGRGPETAGDKELQETRNMLEISQTRCQEMEEQLCDVKDTKEELNRQISSYRAMKEALGGLMRLNDVDRLGEFSVQLDGISERLEDAKRRKEEVVQATRLEISALREELEAAKTQMAEMEAEHSRMRSENYCQEEEMKLMDRAYAEAQLEMERWKKRFRSQQSELAAERQKTRQIIGDQVQENGFSPRPGSSGSKRLKRQEL